MVHITINERYDDFGRPVKPFGTVHPFFPKNREMPDWWAEFGWDIQIHDGKFYCKGVEIVQIENYELPGVRLAIDPMNALWSLQLEDGTRVLYRPESWVLANSLCESVLWRRNLQRWVYQK